jgi:short-subunit dehydrogenase
MKRIVFITGATKGIGLELAKKYQSNGDIVATCSFERQSEVDVPKDIKYYQVDVRDKDSLSCAIHDFANTHGKLDIVIANAGIRMDKAKIPNFDQGRMVIDVNVHGVLNTFEPAINIMKKQKNGHIAALASISGIFGLPGMGIYGASKAAVIHLCESLEIDLKIYGINVSAIAPAFIKTDQALSNSHPLPFMIEAKDAANRIFKSIEKNKGLVIFPLPMMLISIILYYLPRAVYKRFMSFDLLGLSK